MRLHSHLQEPCPKLWGVGEQRGPWRTWRKGPRLVSDLPPETQSWSQGQPWRSPCNKPLHLPSSKDSFPNLSARLPTCLPAQRGAAWVPTAQSAICLPLGHLPVGPMWWLV